MNEFELLINSETADFGQVFNGDKEDGTGYGKGIASGHCGWECNGYGARKNSGWHDNTGP